MRKRKKIGGFAVEAIPHVRRGQVEWSAWLIDLPFVHATRPTLDEARQALAVEWDKVANAYREAGEPVPMPRSKAGTVPRTRGNQRILATVRRLAESKTEPIF
ncbi:HicB family protein [Burkholderiales bacterium GJ-E10]|nr:HicB family protein [Burkholderiales bacterium GJ-E10]